MLDLAARRSCNCLLWQTCLAQAFQVMLEVAFVSIAPRFRKALDREARFHFEYLCSMIFGFFYVSQVSVTCGQSIMSVGDAYADKRLGCFNGIVILSILEVRRRQECVIPLWVMRIKAHGSFHMLDRLGGSAHIN